MHVKLLTTHTPIDNWTPTFIIHFRSDVPVPKRLRLEFTDSDSDEEVAMQPGDSDSGTDNDSDTSETLSFVEEVESDAISDMK